MSVLLLGGNGQVGSALRAALTQSGQAWRSSTRSGELPNGTPCARCDLAIPGSAAGLIATLRPTVVINATAYTAVDRAESEPELAQRINAEALTEIGEAAKKIGARVVHYSTDYVFAGDATQPYRETDPTDPQSIYGRSKRDGEQALLDSGAESLTLRLAWVFAAEGQNFLRTMLRVGAERESLRVVADQIGAPTPAHWIAEATLKATDAELQGLYHLTPQGQTSWHAYAEALFAQAVERGLLSRAPQVQAIPTSEYPTPARRPAWSVLDSHAIARDGGIALPHWSLGVAEVLDQIATTR